MAEHAGNSVEVLLTRYAKCLDGRQDVANRRIAELLGDDDGQEGGYPDETWSRLICAALTVLTAPGPRPGVFGFADGGCG